MDGTGPGALEITLFKIKRKASRVMVMKMKENSILTDAKLLAVSWLSCGKTLLSDQAVPSRIKFDVLPSTFVSI